MRLIHGEYKFSRAQWHIIWLAYRLLRCAIRDFGGATIYNRNGERILK